MIHTERGDGLTVSVIEEGGSFAVSARVGRREGVLAHRADKRQAKALARSVVACEALPGFRQWLVSGKACELRDVF